MNGDKCVDWCEAPNSIVSLKTNLGLNAPMCRYCIDGCVDCKEDDVSDQLYCTKCQNGSAPVAGVCA